MRDAGAPPVGFLKGALDFLFEDVLFLQSKWRFSFAVVFDRTRDFEKISRVILKIKSHRGFVLIQIKRC